MITNEDGPSRVLVVDDDQSIVTFVCTALERLGLKSDVALTGDDAIRMAQRVRYAGVLLDLRLPDVDGLDVLRQFRQASNRVPVIVLTGNGTIQAAVKAMKLGAADFLEKPVSPADLSQAVHMQFRIDGMPDQRATGFNRLVDQVAKAVVAVIGSPVDVPTVRAWCVVIGKSESSLYAMCEMTEVSAKKALDLARLLRVARLKETGDFRKLFDVADPRTTQRLLERAGTGTAVRSVADLLECQQLVQDRSLNQRIAFHLLSRS